MITAISSLIIAVLGLVFFDAWKGYLNQEVIVELQHQSRQTVDEVTTFARLASSIAPSVNDGQTTYTSDRDTVIFKLPALDSSYNIITDVYDYLVINRPPNSALVEQIMIAQQNSQRTAWPKKLTLNTNLSRLEISYFNAAGSELIAGMNDLTTTARLTILCQSTKQSFFLTHSRQFESTVSLRNTGF